MRRQSILAGAVVICGMVVWWIAGYFQQYSGSITMKSSFLRMLGCAGIISALFCGYLFRMKQQLVKATNIYLWIAFIVILLFSAWLRILGWDIFPQPESQFVEEAQTMTSINISINRGTVDAYFPLTVMIGETGFRFFGPSLDNVRAAFVIWSLFGVGLAILAAVMCFKDIRTVLWISLAVGTAEFLAGSSRIALETMAPVTTVFLVLCSMVLHYRHPGYISAGLCGFANGFIFLEHFSFKLMAGLSFAMLLFFPVEHQFPVTTVHDKRKRGFRHAALMTVFMVSLTAVVMPVLLIDKSNPFVFILEGFNRQNNQNILNLMHSDPMQFVIMRLKNLLVVSQYLFIRSDNSEILPFHRGIMDPLSGCLGIAGLIYCLLTFRRNLIKLYVSMIVILVIFLSAILVTFPSRYRLLPMVPAYWFCIGFLLDALFLKIRHHHGKWAVWALTIVAVGGINVHLFFGRDMIDRDVQESFRDENMKLAYLLGDLQKQAPGSKIYLVSDRDYFSQENDYSFSYDWKKVVVIHPDDITLTGEGWIVAHDRFISNALHIEHLCNCRVIRPQGYRCIFLVARTGQQNNNCCKITERGITSTPL